MSLSRVAALVSLGVIALSATGCAGAAPADTQTTEISRSGEVVSFMFDAGLACDVFDTNSGGGVSCDFASFEAPRDWTAGVVDTFDVADGEATVVAFEDGHFCVTFDGNRSGGITCSYPQRTPKTA